MTSDDIYGTKSTDNSAAELLTEELADAYLQVAAGNREIPATVEKAAKYEKLRPFLLYKKNLALWNG